MESGIGQTLQNLSILTHHALHGLKLLRSFGIGLGISL